jgi:hypothetical protein
MGTVGGFLRGRLAAAPVRSQDVLASSGVSLVGQGDQPGGGRFPDDAPGPRRGQVVLAAGSGPETDTMSPDGRRWPGGSCRAYGAWRKRNLLSESPAPPALRAALYDLAASLPGVRLIRGAHDLVGRAATEVYQPGGWNEPGGGGQALFFSPRTGVVLGAALLSGASPHCPILGASAVLAAGYVNSTDQVPPDTPGHLLPASFRKHVTGCAAP